MNTEETKIGSKADEKASCSNCKNEFPITETQIVRQKNGDESFLCNSCADVVEQKLAVETKNPNLMGAVIGGIVGAVLGGIVWYLVTVLSGYEIGYVALGVGYLVGMGVYLGSGKKRGFQLQSISVLLSFIAIFTAKYFVTIYFVKQLAQEFGGELTDVFEISLSPFDPLYLESLVDPMGLLIWGIALYIAFRVPQARKL